MSGTVSVNVCKLKHIYHFLLYYNFLTKKITSHLSPVTRTCHLSLVTSHLSPLTSHLSPITCHWSPVTCHLSPVIYHLSPITCHLSPVARHLTTTLCSFSCHESPRKLGDAAARGLLINRVGIYIFFGLKKNRFDYSANLGKNLFD